MFLRRHEPILLVEDGIEGLCESLNRPVVDLEDFPTGPARAVIALYRDGSGERRLAVTVRSEDSGAVILFAFRGELNSETVQALDHGLQFAEGMGFLFDEDVLAENLSGARRNALETWCELTGDELPIERPASARQPAEVADEVLLLDEMSDGLEADLDEDLPPLDPPPVGQILSKFRQPADAPPTAANPGGGTAQLGRIPIVRRRKEGGEPAATEVPPLLARLLARF
jgi:hypothetical protein